MYDVRVYVRMYVYAYVHVPARLCSVREPSKSIIGVVCHFVLPNRFQILYLFPSTRIPSCFESSDDSIFYQLGQLTWQIGWNVFFFLILVHTCSMFLNTDKSHRVVFSTFVLLFSIVERMKRLHQLIPLEKDNIVARPINESDSFARSYDKVKIKSYDRSRYARYSSRPTTLRNSMENEFWSLPEILVPFGQVLKRSFVKRNSPWESN